MRKLDLPNHNDMQTLLNLAISENRSRTLVGYMMGIADRYHRYVESKGDPWVTLESDEFVAIADLLRGLYEAPVTELAFIRPLRQGISGACPMCGRVALGTLDHVFPKNPYPEFSFFSPNLVPCCDRCNNVRNDEVRGTHAPSRPVHPYFDNFLAKQVLSTSFAPDWRAPSIIPVPFGVRSGNRKVVEWQIENVLMKSGVQKHYEGLWGQLVAHPKVICGRSSVVEDIKDRLMDIEMVAHATSQSKNSWDAAFWHGLQRNKRALKFLGEQVASAP